MEDKTVQSTLRRMKILFIAFVVLLPIGIIIIVSSSYQSLGIAVFGIGGVSGIICAFTTCPCCGQLSGVFFKGFIGGAFPIGSCIHCKQSYLGVSGCNSES